jgi:outer membrane autotransporter protein
MRTAPAWGLAVAAFVLAFQKPAAAQPANDAFPGAVVTRSGPSDPPVQPTDDRKDPRVSIVLHAKASSLSGEVDSGLGVDYDDLFETGFGLELEGAYLFTVGKWSIGPYLALGWETYDGDRFTDALGDTLETESLDLLSVVAGFEAIVHFAQGLFLNLHIGFGAADYSAVEGTVTISGIPMSVDVFESTTAFAFALGARFGYQVDRFMFDLGLGVRSQGAPDAADLDLSSSAAVALIAEVGVGVSF